jgi:acyl carrier protein
MTKNTIKMTLESSVKKYVNQYTSLTKKYMNLDDGLISETFQDTIYSDSLGYVDFLYNIEDSEILELYDAQFDLANKVNKLESIIKNIQENRMLMSNIKSIYA